MREDFQAVLDEAGHGKHIVCLPAGPAIAALKLLEAMKLSPLYKWVYETAATDSFVSIEKAEQKLHYRPRYPTKTPSCATTAGTSTISSNSTTPPASPTACPGNRGY